MIKNLILVSIFLLSSIASLNAQTDPNIDSVSFKFEPLPILSYDTNTGFGYGAKAFLLNALKNRESFDLILFASSKGERWCRLAFSIPDFELRQGKEYPLALDLIVDFDRWISYYFYGVGNLSRYKDEEKYTRRVFETSIFLSRGFSRRTVGQFSIRYRNITTSNLEADGQLLYLPSTLNQRSVEYFSIYSAGRYDTRNSFINPSTGQVVQAEIEWAPDLFFNTVDYLYWSAWYQRYRRLPFLKTVLAGRVGLRQIIADQVPVQILLPVGGNNTLRGFSQDRFLDKVSMVLNMELRFPVYKRLGATAGIDAGKVWHSFQKINFHDWSWNPVIGLRFYMDTYVVRLDVGISRETTALYLNFGHVF